MIGEEDRARDFALVRRAVLEAGIGVLRAFGGPHVVKRKGPDQPVTPADIASDATLRRVLGRARPDYGWLSEETTDRPDRLSRDRVWIVDPIDGTRSYIAGRPEYALSVGLAESGHAVLGVILNPSTGELFGAVRGGGAWLERIPPTERGLSDALASGDPERSDRVRLHVTERTTATGLTLLASRSEIAAGEMEPFAEWTLRPSGSTAYKLGGIAAGRADAFFSRGPKSEWDVCAGVVLVQEAGGRATDLHGVEAEFNRPEPSVHGIVATNGRLHETVLRRLAELDPLERMSRPADRQWQPGEGKNE